jgi:adenylate cyclase
MGAAVLAGLGEPDRAATWVSRALAIDREEPIILYNAACVYVALGSRAEALDCLEASVRYGDISRGWIQHDPDLDALRGEPRFEALAAQSP